ncbi:MAG TPA: TIGR02452 family protein [Kofleriaceae bacterium]|nr:TIGR02452 family protein [Kofleriaceae bacterium]
MSAAAARDARIAIAHATVAACDAGFYVRDDGARVELAPAIAAAKAGTRLYERGVDVLPAAANARAMAISVTDETVIAAVRRLAPTAGHLACLNFASAKNPGGGFLTGAHAQEEAIARASALYPCQLTQPAHYERNRAHRSGLYLDLAIWSPHVPVFRDDAGAWLAAPLPVSIITCAAPNAGAYRGDRVEAAGQGDRAAHDAQTEAEIAAVLDRRARFVLAIARHHAVDTLVLGAWGAGVFSNDPEVVARAFRDPLRQELAGAFAQVVFAVPGSVETSDNHRAFVAAFA